MAAIVPALLGTILIFMDQQITAVIVNRKENKLEVNRAGVVKVVSCTGLGRAAVYCYPVHEVVIG